MSVPSLHAESTVAAISTPPGAGGIAVVRMTGPDSLSILRAVFRPHSDICSFRSHHMYYGQVVEPRTGEPIDEAMALFMAGPKSYTREDVVEIHGHGNSLLAHRLLETLLAQGASLAEPGEFTKRAFLNGRIDLTSAEAVLDVLAARTRKGLEMAERQLAGALFQRLASIRERLLHGLAILEVAIDFPDEEEEIVDWRLLAESLRGMAAEFADLLAASRQGQLLREGARVVICGLPNVGKSSLLNALLCEERALVTAIPGTTRDTIEEYFDLNGLPVRCIDTAGIRDDADLVEAQGIVRARAAIDRADLLLLLHDATRPWLAPEDELLATLGHKPLLYVLNKIDAAPAPPAAAPSVLGEPLAISALTGQGLDALRQAMFHRLTDGASQWEENSCAPNLRQTEAIRRALDAINRAQETLALRAPDLLTVELRECLDELNGMIGLTTTDDVLDAIFSRFCLGK
ncbi:MAG: tRNA uridine-5-carboxymethylaminomethyl(34) synthesis GTPase MnmE [Desulfobulbaceae bacterium]|jgi:tRNA modification GTPase|nr:tRNA uridine-5-carboxymethylaminomethyl(34) synthesis GTPase MnmE [Desulfobulbaceae bacterium]